MSLNYSFSGKRVLVTGGASGIGRQLVQRFSEHGAVVFTIDKNAELLQALKAELPNVKAEVVDVTDWKATRAVVESFGKIDHLVNNAGVLINQPFLEITEEIAALQYNIQIQATINVTQVAAKGMIESGTGGTIVNVASLGARKVVEGLAAYCAAKAALVSLTRSMALELGPHGIRANCICPGYVDTPLSQQPHLSDVKEQALAKMVIKRAITVDEITDLVMFLLSPSSAMMTGADIPIEGGSLLM